VFHDASDTWLVLGLANYGLQTCQWGFLWCMKHTYQTSSNLSKLKRSERSARSRGLHGTTVELWATREAAECHRLRPAKTCLLCSSDDPMSRFEPVPRPWHLDFWLVLWLPVAAWMKTPAKVNVIECYGCYMVVIWLLYGFIWLNMALYGFIWLDMGFIWFYMGFILCEFIWVYLGLYEFIWFYMGLYEFIWVYMCLYGLYSLYNYSSMVF